MDETSPVERLAAGLEAGKTAALARAISLVECAEAEALTARLRASARDALVIGVTGPPGAGKSTLISAMISGYREKGQKVAVLAVDPSSPLSGGAILGDRTRMGAHNLDDGVFIRSFSARGHMGGLCESVFEVVDLVAAAGWEIVIVEAVGAGQSEVEIAGIADIAVVVCAPGLGDDIQAIKAGILEIADILVVNKADRDNADRTAQQLAGSRDAPVLKTVATTGDGVPALLEVIAGNVPSEDGDRRAGRLRSALAGMAADMVRRELASDPAALGETVKDVLEGRTTLRRAARQAASGLHLKEP